MTGVDVLPGDGLARIRGGQPLTGPLDVPAWMARGGGVALAAAAAVAGDALAVRRVADTLGSVLSDTASALGWQGSAAQAAQGRADSLRAQLGLVAHQLDDAQDALAGFASALDAQQPVLFGAQLAWDRTSDPDLRLALLRRWQPAVRALDAADGRAAGILADVAAGLARVHVTVADAGAAPTPAHGAGVLDGALHGVGSFCAGALNAVASLGNAMDGHPDQVALLVSGLLLTQLGLGGEALGVALDATGIGAVIGVPANVVSAAAVAAGTGVALTAAGRLAVHAATDDRVSPVHMDGGASASGGPAGSAPPAGAGPQVDIEGANFAQRTASRTFSAQGNFRGRAVDEVAAALRAGRLTPDDVPVNVVVRDGRTLILNTRSAAALDKAGVPRSQWNVVDRTAQPDYERRLTDQLNRNGLDADGVGSVLRRR